MQRRRRRRAGIALVVCAAVGALAVAVPDALRSGDPGSAVAAGPTIAPVVATPALDCPHARTAPRGHGASDLAAGAIDARLCLGVGDMSGAAPLDVLATGLDRLVRSVNEQPPSGNRWCNGPVGSSYLLLLGYPDGTERHVVLNFSGCGSIGVSGQVSRQHPEKPYGTFMDLLRSQRESATPPATVPPPVCLPQYSSFSPVADPVDMVAARLCVTYNDDGRTTSVAVPAADLTTILDAWRSAPTTALWKGPGCAPTTPTWVLSGVTQWGDQVQITAECNQPAKGQGLVDLTPTAQQAVDRLVDRAGVRIDDGTEATTAWLLALAWLRDVNAHAIVTDAQTAAHMTDVANSLWVRDPWFPDGELDWDLLGASRIEVSGWRQAWQIPARTPVTQAVFVVVRHGSHQPWRILSITR